LSPRFGFMVIGTSFELPIGARLRVVGGGDDAAFSDHEVVLYLVVTLKVINVDLWRRKIVTQKKL